MRDECDGVTAASSKLAMDCSELGSTECEDCVNKSECVECIVKRVREEHGWDGHGGVTTAQCTSTPGCSDLGASSSSASGCGGASSSFS